MSYSAYAGFAGSQELTCYGTNVQKFKLRQLEEEKLTTENKTSVYSVYALKDVTRLRVVYPSGKAEEYAELRRIFHENYGPYSKKKFCKVTQNQLNKIFHRKPNDAFKTLGNLAALIHTQIVSFRLMRDLSEDLLIVNYSKMFQHENALLNPEYKDPKYPQEKMRRAMEIVTEFIQAFKILAEEYFITRPNLIYQFTPIVFNSFMERCGNLSHILYGTRLAREGWLSETMGKIVSDWHQEYFNWKKILSRLLPLPSDVCEIIGDYLALDIGQPFSKYFKSISDSEGNIRLEHAHKFRMFQHNILSIHGTREVRETFTIGLLQYIN